MREAYEHTMDCICWNDSAVVNLLERCYGVCLLFPASSNQNE